jgi:uncharacterized membrane protein YhaH (DUF805 family)
VNQAHCLAGLHFDKGSIRFDSDDATVVDFVDLHGRRLIISVVRLSSMTTMIVMIIIIIIILIAILPINISRWRVSAMSSFTTVIMVIAVMMMMLVLYFTSGMSVVVVITSVRCLLSTTKLVYL